ncbi:MAG: Trm112 family protein [Acidobacteriaceae bacterium]
MSLKLVTIVHGKGYARLLPLASLPRQHLNWMHMQTDTISPALMDILICPACHTKVEPAQDGLQCSGCGRLYSIVDGIPVMLADRARPPMA